MNSLNTGFELRYTFVSEYASDSDILSDSEDNPASNLFYPVTTNVPLHEPFSSGNYFSCNVTEVLKESTKEGKTVLLAQLSDSGENTPPVVIKFAWFGQAFEELQHEAEAYERLEALQGKYIPRLFGHFQGETNWGTAQCIVMSYAGKHIDDGARSLSRAGRSAPTSSSPFCSYTDRISRLLRRSIYEALRAIHAAGYILCGNIIHGITPNNIVFSEESQRGVLIGFSDMKQHNSPCPYASLEDSSGLELMRYTVRPRGTLPGCFQINKFLSTEDFWLRAYPPLPDFSHHLF